MSIDYDSVTADDLEVTREPRKSTIKVKHKPTNTVAETPVAPGTLAEVRFRRPTVLPKENRRKGMEGYIEPVDDSGAIWFIVEADGDTPAKNEYLDALANDKAALKASFEGRPATPKPEKAKTDTPAEPAKPEPTTDTETAPAAEVIDKEAPAEPPADAVGDELDELLSGLQ